MLKNHYLITRLEDKILKIERVCRRCGTPVSYDDVSPGYFAVCPEHDEDLYLIETVAR